MVNIKKAMIGKKFGKLIVLNEIERNDHSAIYYLCQCDCGKQTTARGSKLRAGSKSSCGCLQRECALSKIPKMIELSTKYSPEQSLAVRIWKKHYDDDGLTFSDFMHICQQNCHYCNSVPYNLLKSANAQFAYNGLDRIDSSLGHTKDNCVACCIICNRGKSNQLYSDAIHWMRRLSTHFAIDKPKIWQEITINQQEKRYARTIYRIMKRKTTDLSFEEFYNLSKQKCYYCDGDFSNSYGSFAYNGLDRADSSIAYLKSNVVPCCKWCNFAKKNLSLQLFSEWIDRLKTKQISYQKCDI